MRARAAARRAAVGLAAVVAVLLPGTPVWAHTALVSADPAKDATLARAPSAVTLVFSQSLNPDFTTIVVSDASRRRVPAAPPSIKDGAGTVALSGALTNGAYTVAYRVVSTDGHTVQGSYVFTVADPAQPAAVAPSVAAAAPPAPADRGRPALVLAGLAALAVVLAAAAWWLVMRRRAAAGRPPTPA